MRITRFFAAVVIIGGLLAAGVNGGQITIGTGTSTQYYPLGTYSRQCGRTQIIYLTSELGQAKTLTSLGVNIASFYPETTSSLATANAFTIRLKHTDLSDYSTTPGWQSSGWTTVYQASRVISSTGWVTFIFSAPFGYNGDQNLMVDILFNGSSWSASAACVSTSTSGRTLAFNSDNTYGDPLTWSAPTNPVYTPYIRFGYELDTVQTCDVTGMTPSEAQAAILANGFNIGNITKDFSDAVPVGTVCSQSPAAGQDALKGTLVDIVISVGPRYPGSGTTEDPYRISTKTQLLAMGAYASDYDKCFVLTDDIDMEGELFDDAVIAPGLFVNYPPSGIPFTGIFNGNGHVIKNYRIDSGNNTAKMTGLFGYIGTGGQIYSLGVEGSVHGYNRVGCLAGYCRGTVSNCYSIGQASGYSYVSGLIGTGGCTITNCYSTVVVCGYPGPVHGLSVVSADNSFWDVEVSGQTIGGGTGLTTAQMQDINTYLAAGWDLSDTDGNTAVWEIVGGNYPRLVSDAAATIPDITGMTAGNAEPAILSAGFAVGKVTLVYDSESPTGTVLSQVPAAGTAATVGTSINMSVAFSGWAGGGTPADPYQITSKADFQALAANPTQYDKSFILLTDIDLINQVFSAAVIAPDTDPNADFQGTAFTGTFDGNGHKIKHLSVNNLNGSYLGLFGRTESGGAISNLGIESCFVNGYWYLGGLVGDNHGCNIMNCYTTGSVSDFLTSQYIGGLIGYNIGEAAHCFSAARVGGVKYRGGLIGQSDGGPVSQCYFAGVLVTNTNFVSIFTGGLIGYNNNGSISHCSANGDIYGGGYLGGLVGYNNENSPVSDCYSTGTITSSGNSGGLIGYNNNNSIDHCFSTCNINFSNRSSADYKGGLVGYNKGNITHCYSTGNVLGFSYAGGLAGYQNGDISDSYATGSVYGGTSYCGGLAGYIFTGNITNCYATGLVCGASYVGGLAGACDSNTHISDCYATGSVALPNYSSPGSYSGGLVGRVASSTVSRCYATGSIYCLSNSSSVSGYGGLIGESNSSTISQCYATGSVTTTGVNSIGGLVGRNISGFISNCFSSGSVSGNNYIGGLAGVSSSGSIINCYSTGPVSGTSYLGGLIGGTASNNVINSFWDIQISGQMASNGGAGKSSGQMRDIQTFLAAGWDYIDETDNGTDDYWQMQEGCGYPEFAIFPNELPKPSLGSGTANDPYIISTADELEMIAHRTSASYKLANDIDFEGSARPAPIVPVFQGVLDGNGFCIQNLSISGGNDLGLIGQLEPSGQIRNLAFENCSVSGSTYVGSLVGWNQGSIIQCYSTGAVGGTNYVGGLVGYNGGTVSLCYSMCSVNGNQYVGGLVGDNAYGYIGLCYSTGLVSGSGYTGGLVGENGYYSSTSMGIVFHCFWDTMTSGQAFQYYGRGIGKITPEMQYIGTFLNMGWDFTNERANGTSNYWQMPAGGGYPQLAIFHGVTPPKPAGSGTEEDPYLIADANDLGTIGYRPSAYYRLSGDIDLDEIQWGMAVVPEFSGVFDGNDFTIRNLRFKGGSYLGLFGKVTMGVIKNLSIENCILNSCYHAIGSSQYYYDDIRHVGSLAGDNWGSISNCYSHGVVNSNSLCYIEDLGGLVGYNGGQINHCIVTFTEIPLSIDSHLYPSCNIQRYIGGVAGTNIGTISQCYASSIISACYPPYRPPYGVLTTNQIGGLVGYNHYGSINQCASRGYLSGSDAGGLAGHNDYGNISNSYSRCITSTGGLVGRLNYGKISYCYSAQAAGGAGAGLIGTNTGGTIMYCRWDSQTAPGLTGGGGFNTAQMQDPNTYINATWDFVDETANGTGDYWQMPEGGGYPELAALQGMISPMPAGKGTQDNPYIITDVNDLKTMAYQSTSYYKLVDDIDLAGIEWPTVPIPLFYGVLDGNGFCVRNMTISESGDNHGLIGTLGLSGQIKNLGLEDCFINGTSNVGGLVGNSYGTISSCYVTGVISGESKVGGMVGQNYGTITNSYVTADQVSGLGYVGGFVGYNTTNSVTPSMIKNCYSSSAVAGSASLSTGGFCGYTNSTITMSFWDKDVSGLTTSVSGGIYRTTAQMQTLSTFTTSPGNWDFAFETVNGTDDTWRMCTDGVDYPRLTWEFISHGDWICPDGTGTEDLSALTSCWLETVQAKSDINDDDAVDFEDVVKLSQNWLMVSCGTCNDADITDDGNVDGLDLEQMTGQWLMIENAGCRKMDLNNDGRVDLGDFSVFTGYWLDE